MQACADCGARQGVVAGLKRPGGIRHREQARPSRAQSLQAGRVDAGSVERFNGEPGAETPRERVQARLGDLVAGYPEPQQDEVRRTYLQNQDAMRQIESAALEDQVVEWVLGRANITDKPMTFKEITGFGQEQAT